MLPLWCCGHLLSVHAVLLFTVVFMTAVPLCILYLQHVHAVFNFADQICRDQGIAGQADRTALMNLALT